MEAGDLHQRLLQSPHQLERALGALPLLIRMEVAEARLHHQPLVDARAHGVHPGYALGRDYEGLDDAVLVAVTERRTPADIDRLVEVLSAR
jgi:glycine cleavage system pyridoxal-binding protein P